MPAVRMKKLVSGQHITRHPGRVYVVSQNERDQLVADGLAEDATAPEAAAMRGAPERAAMRGAEKR